MMLLQQYMLCIHSTSSNVRFCFFYMPCKWCLCKLHIVSLWCLHSEHAVYYMQGYMGHLRPTYLRMLAQTQAFELITQSAFTSGAYP